MTNFSAPARIRKFADLALFVGRFSPFHYGHLSVITAALEAADNLVILTGSADQPRDWFVPFTDSERAEMIMASIPERLRQRIIILPLLDYLYNNGQWLVDVQEAVKNAREYFNLGPLATVMLVGHSKDKSSYYLKQFPQFVSMEVNNYHNLSATPLRKSFFEDNGSFRNELNGVKALPDGTMDFLGAFRKTSDFDYLVDEFQFIENYKKPFAALPYKPIFTTVDACVVQSGHVLLIERRARPGKGLWALPGGFLNHDEWVDDAVIRELNEETKIKVPADVLRGSIVTQRKFDAPFRSARGRTITFASLIHLKPMMELPKVKGSDDAKKAKWFPLADVKRSMMFEDHFHLINYFQSFLDREPK